MECYLSEEKRGRLRLGALRAFLELAVYKVERQCHVFSSSGFFDEILPDHVSAACDRFIYLSIWFYQVSLLSIGKMFHSITLALAGLVAVTQAGYTLKDTYDASNWFSKFSVQAVSDHLRVRVRVLINSSRFRTQLEAS